MAGLSTLRFPLFPALDSGVGGSGSSAARREPIVLFCDLKVDPDREQRMLETFHRVFKPAAEKFDGYIDAKMLRLLEVKFGGPAPEPGTNYRLQLTFESEEKRQIWIASEVHGRIWPMIEECLTDLAYLVLLTQSM